MEGNGIEKDIPAHLKSACSYISRMVFGWALKLRCWLTSTGNVFHIPYV